MDLNAFFRYFLKSKWLCLIFQKLRKWMLILLQAINEFYCLSKNLDSGNILSLQIINQIIFNSDFPYKTFCHLEIFNTFWKHRLGNNNKLQNIRKQHSNLNLRIRSRIAFYLIYSCLRFFLLFCDITVKIVCDNQ